MAHARRNALRELLLAEPQYFRQAGNQLRKLLVRHVTGNQVDHEGVAVGHYRTGVGAVEDLAAGRRNGYLTAGDGDGQSPEFEPAHHLEEEQIPRQEEQQHADRDREPERAPLELPLLLGLGVGRRLPACDHALASGLDGRNR